MHQKKVPRITPAGAGKTTFVNLGMLYLRDHPRRCGENRLCRIRTSSRLGSPPQVRGKRIRSRCYRYSPKDHPRRCGENRAADRKIKSREGSPPQVRGKPKHRSEVDARLRITPAGAGKTLFLKLTFPVVQDHPRRCGENLRYILPSIVVSGSPPQVRGKHWRYVGSDCGGGITPAGAGKTDTGEKTITLSEDHPRRCGENRSYPFDAPILAGSPPQVRGKPRRRLRNWHFVRITPAGAGKTTNGAKVVQDGQDHPRRCGENCIPDRSIHNHLGSPPQVRGKPSKAIRIAPEYRITPAGAGKT